MKKFTLPSRIIHWLSALSIIFLFVSGWFMVDLDYYSSWYQTLPDIHQLVGVLLMVLWFYKVLRLYWVKYPEPVITMKRHEIIISTVVKTLFYILVLALCVSGYMMSTGGNDQHALLDLIMLPTLLVFNTDILDLLGNTHKYMAYVIMVLMLLHILAALKHHFIDHDDTLRRMI